MKIKKFFELIAAIVVCQLAGIIGSVFSNNAMYDWYDSLNKPAFTPPDAVFGPVWVALYLLMGIALWLVWQKLKVKKWHFWTTKNKVAYVAITLFFIQLLLNTLWSIVFFGMQNPLAALVVIVELLVFIAITVVWFWKVDKLASILLWPYLGWVGFATVLNLMIVILNTEF